MTTIAIDDYTRRAKAVRVVDGDTIVVDIDLGVWVWKHGETLRLLGVDTPEKFGIKKWIDKDAGLLTEEYSRGQAASDFTTKWIKDNAPDGNIVIRTVKDQSGKYGRLLVEVFSLGGLSLNQALLESGHATALDY